MIVEPPRRKSEVLMMLPTHHGDQRFGHAAFVVGHALLGVVPFIVSQKFMMRCVITMLGVFLLCASGHAQVKDYQVYTIIQSAISHSQPVSFSIGYPNGWTKCENGRNPTGELLTTDDEHVCGFWSNAAVSDWATITVFRASGATAREAAEGFAASVRQTSSSYSQTRFAPIKTKAGDTGYLVVFEAHWERGDAMVSDLFFHVGAKGAIRISIMTRAGDPVVHETLQKLVLETLHF